MILATVTDSSTMTPSPDRPRMFSPKDRESRERRREATMALPPPPARGSRSVLPPGRPRQRHKKHIHGCARCV